MIIKGFSPTNMVYNSLINSLSLASKLDEAIRIRREMIDKLGVLEFITYKTLVDELSREGKRREGRKLLHEFYQKDRSLDGISYRKLLDQMHSRSETMD
ncbi:hypothetical protein SUGI_1111210 [Cryptomeria japonica]|nr:hypothetical protein SUGI_1111210 [Cryptomeria japonica]